MPIEKIAGFTLISISCWCLAAAASSSPQTSMALEIGQYRSVVTHDIFDPERGKKDDVTSSEDMPDVDADELKKRFVIYGVIINGPENRHAFIKDKNEKGKKEKGKTKLYKKVTQGDLLNGWKIEKIEPSGITLVMKDKTVMIPVFDRGKKERKATRPVAMETPQPQTSTSPAQRGTAARPSHDVMTSSGAISNPNSRINNSQAKGQLSKPLRLPTSNSAKKQRNVGGASIFNGIGGHSSPNSAKQPGAATPSNNANNPFLQLLKNVGK